MAPFWNAAMDWTLHEVTDDLVRLRSSAGSVHIWSSSAFPRSPGGLAFTSIRVRTFMTTKRLRSPSCELWARSMLTLGRATCRGWCSQTPRAMNSVSSRRADSAV